MRISAFDQWLKKGLGRAVVHLRTHDPEPHRDAVLYACTHDLAYDSCHKLGESLAAVQIAKPLDQATTFSLPALQAWNEGVRIWRRMLQDTILNGL